MSDVTIFYQGGSGGFALYYYLLLSGRYQYDVETVNHMIEQQFPGQLATDPHTWKEKEFWPDNVKLKQEFGSTVFLVCNPLFDPTMYETNQSIGKGTYKILLYTDIHLQLRLAYEKKAYWFTSISKQHFNAPVSTKKYLQQILNTSVLYKDIQVDPMIPKIIDTFFPEKIIRLEDFIKTPTIDDFPTSTPEQIKFLNHWKLLQPPKAFLLKT